MLEGTSKNPFEKHLIMKTKQKVYDEMQKPDGFGFFFKSDAALPTAGVSCIPLSPITGTGDLPYMEETKTSVYY